MPIPPRIGSIALRTTDPAPSTAFTWPPTRRSTPRSRRRPEPSGSSSSGLPPPRWAVPMASWPTPTDTSGRSSTTRSTSSALTGGPRSRSRVSTQALKQPHNARGGNVERTYEGTTRRPELVSSAAGVDWTDVAQVDRALRVFESQLRWLARQEWHRASSFDEVRELLDHDGLELDERCRIRWRRSPALEATLTGLTDPSGIRAELERIRRALPHDPAARLVRPSNSWRQPPRSCSPNATCLLPTMPRFPSS